MKTTKTLPWILIMCAALCFNVFAKDVQSTATLQYEKSVFSDDHEARNKAIVQARTSAWKKYTSEFSEARKSIYAKNEKIFMDKLGSLIIEESVVQEKNDKDNNLYKIAIRVNIDDNAVAALFNDISASGNQGLGESSDFGSVFIARTKTEAKSYDAKRVNIKESEGEDSVSHTIASSEAKSVDAASTKSFSRTASGGSTTTKRTETKWELDTALQDKLSASMEETLVNSGFEPMSYEILTDHGAPFLDEILEEATTETGTLTGRTLKAIKTAALDAGWSFFGYGTVDMDIPIIDSATGHFKVAATVQYKVFMFKDGKDKTIATVRPTQVYGMAETEDFAINEALNKAAQTAIRTVVDQLQQKGVR